MLQCFYDWRSRGQDHLGCERDQLFCVFAKKSGVSRPPAIIEQQIPPIDPTHFLERIVEGVGADLPFWIIRSQVHEHSDAPHWLGLLRLRSERHCESGATKPSDKIAPPHWIASSQLTLPRYQFSYPRSENCCDALNKGGLGLEGVKVSRRGRISMTLRRVRCSCRCGADDRSVAQADTTLRRLTCAVGEPHHPCLAPSPTCIRRLRL